MADVVQLEYLTDVLCVWAYVAQVRLEELRAECATGGLIGAGKE